MNKFFKKQMSIFLTSVLLITSCSSFVFADNSEYMVTETNGYRITEKNNDFTMEYDQIENGRTVHYFEETNGNVINTKKFYNNNSRLELFEEINTTIESKINGSIIATVSNITNNTVKIQVVREPNIVNYKSNVFALSTRSSKEWHPLASDYYKTTSSTGHLGVANLTNAAMTWLITTIITKGNIVLGTIAGVVSAVKDGGWSNLYYEKKHYGAYGSGAGRVLWKEIVKYYYDVERTNQAGNTIYVDSDLLTKY